MEGDHDTDTEFDPAALAPTPIGTLGAVVSPAALPVTRLRLSMSNVAPATGAASTTFTVSESPALSVV